MVTVPEVTVVILPELSMVATPVLVLTQAPPVVASVNCVLLPIQVLGVPPIGAITGRLFTVTLKDTESVQPLLLVTI